MTHIIELKKSFKMIPNLNQFPGNIHQGKFTFKLLRRRFSRGAWWGRLFTYIKRCALKVLWYIINMNHFIWIISNLNRVDVFQKDYCFNQLELVGIENNIDGTHRSNMPPPPYGEVILEIDWRFKRWPYS